MARHVSLLAVMAAPLAAQSVELRLREAVGETPVAGAIVRLLGEQGVAAQGLSDELGRLVLRAPGPGSYRLRVDRIGWSGLVTEPFTLAASETRRMTLPMDSRRTVLPALEVRGRSGCGRGAERGGPLAGVLWEEIRKALTANLLSDAQPLPLHLKEFLREVSLHGQSEREWTVLSLVARGSAFEALPPSELSSTGFYRAVGDTANFAAPDAALLLSDEFVATHCFRAVPDSARLAGLHFQPVPGRRVPEVQGTLWVDRLSSELRRLDFVYLNLPSFLPASGLGGRVSFARLPNGRWIVSDWYIRMPRFASRTVWVRRDSQVVTRLAGYLDHGGRAEVAGDTVGRVDRAIIRGIVFDSTTGHGLAGAFVSVVGTDDSVPTDPAGRFELAVAVSGDREIRVHHPKLGLLREPTALQVLLSLGDTTRVEFAVPGVETFSRMLCRGQPGAALVGAAWRADGTPAANQAIRMRLNTPEGAQRGPTVAADSHGLFALCGLPPEGTSTISLLNGDRVLGEQQVGLGPAPTWLELREWGSRDSMAAGFPGGSQARGAEPAGPALVRGIVVDSLSGQGVEGAVVRFVAAGRDDSVLSDREGRFELKDSVSGPHLLEVGHPGLGRLRGSTNAAVLLSFGDTATVRLPVIAVDRITRERCGAARGAGLIGLARGSDGAAVAGLSLRVEWLTPAGSRQEFRTSLPGGLYAFCELPAGVELAVQVSDPRGGVGGGRLRLEPGEYRWVELEARGQPY